MTWVIVFVSGVTLLIVSAEKLIAHLVGAASGLRIPLFLLAAFSAGGLDDPGLASLAAFLVVESRVAFDPYPAGAHELQGRDPLILTLAALACGGAIEITVISAQASLSATLDQVAAYWQQDLTVTFNQPERAARVVGEAMQVPGVVAVEQQPATLAVRRRANDSESLVWPGVATASTFAA